MQGERVWRRDSGAILSGVCAGLAEDLDLPLPLVRLVSAVFLILPTGLAYLALSLLLRRRPVRVRSRLGVMPEAPSRGPAAKTETQAAAVQSWALIAHRFEMLEPRLKRMEAFVTSKDFELSRDFRRMEEQSGSRRGEEQSGSRRMGE